MSMTLLTTAALAGIELVVNNVLKLDPQCQQKLSSLEHKVLAICCSSPKLNIFLIVRDRQIKLNSYYEGETDCTINGDANALIKLLLHKNKSQAFYDDDIEVQGQLEVLQELQKVLLTLNIDWEYHLSKFIGDIPTQAMSDTIKSAENFSQNTRDSLVMDFDEYIHDEKKLFPSENEVELFFNRIDQLRLKVDRLEAKINQLK